jgi:hypothetical protein
VKKTALLSLFLICFVGLLLGNQKKIKNKNVHINQGHTSIELGDGTRSDASNIWCLINTGNGYCHIVPKEITFNSGQSDEFTTVYFTGNANCESEQGCDVNYGKLFDPEQPEIFQ